MHYIHAGEQPVTAKAHAASLLPHHRKELWASGLTDATIAAAAIYSETSPIKLAALLGRAKFPNHCAPAIVFPYRTANGSDGYSRIKPDTPRNVGGKPVKYESPVRRANEPYLPPGVAGLLDNPQAELLVTEGEKKALAATQAGFPCIGLGGVFGWKDKTHEHLLPALARIAWKERRVYVVFDADAYDNPSVQDAERRLAKLLADHGASVRIVRLPRTTDTDGKPIKQGLDDFLVSQGNGGPAALKRLLDAAEEPEPVAPSESKLLITALDPGDEARAFLAESSLDGAFRLRYWRGSYWYWRRGAYRQCEPGEVRAEVVRQLDKRFFKLNTTAVANVLEILKAHAMLPHYVESPSWIQTDKPIYRPEELLVTRSKLVHLPSFASGRVVTTDATPRFFTTAALDFDFDPGAPRPDRWLAFLDELLGNDPESINALQEWFGYLLTADTRQHKILLVIGPTRAGKGVIAAIIRELVGSANVAAPTLASLAWQFGLWPLLGKSVALISDARLGNRTDQPIIVERLLSISGEDAMTIDGKYRDQVTGKLSTRILIFSNELPRLFDVSGALASRFVVLRLTESFLGREDKKLTSKLLAELPGILLWAIEGWLRLQQRGYFTQPESGQEMLSDLHDLASPIAVFVRERCDLGAQFRTAAAELYEQWKDWCRESGRDKPGTLQNFCRELTSAFCRLRRTRPKENGERYIAYDGIRLKANC